MKIVYYLSGTSMDILYTENGERYDWGFLQIDVDSGQDVIVRKATPNMIKWADQLLDNLK